MNYYNEWDKCAASWLRELIKAGLIPNGYVDERSITEVTPEDLSGFTQCHFFCGIGGWPLALQLAGIPATFPLWTGSPPCQPFSVAGKQIGFQDPRHLAPAFLDLIEECRPPVIFGEQVRNAIGKHWLDFVLTEMEEEGYIGGSAVLPACSVGAPHLRERLFFGARLHGRVFDQLADDLREQLDRGGPSGSSGRIEFADLRSARQLDHGNSERRNRQYALLQRTQQENMPEIARTGEDINTIPHYGFWSDADWLGCRDGKFRPVEPGTFPLANGVPARVGRLRGYGNAIVPQAAAKFIKAFVEST